MRTKHTFRLPPDLASKLAEYATRKGVSQALVVEAAIASCRVSAPAMSWVLVYESPARRHAGAGAHLNLPTGRMEGNNGTGVPFEGVAEKVACAPGVRGFPSMRRG